MSKDYNYKNYYSISEAMKIHNNIMPGPKFTLLDYNILCLVRSFYESNQKFYMSNEQLAELFFSCEKTVRSSIKRLEDSWFITKELIDGNRRKGRYLYYQKDVVEKFITDMQLEFQR